MTLRRFTQGLLAAALVFVWMVAPAGAALTQDELLEPEKAFQISTRPIDENNVEVRFGIAHGYYMYRDRFKFETAAGQLLANVDLPPGILKTDPFFGETQTYRREAIIRVPLAREHIEHGRVKLKVTSQGCADAGVCYVPQEQVVEVALAGGSPIGGTSITNASAPANSASATAAFSRLRFLLAPQWALALGALLIIAGVWFRAVDPLPQGAGGAARLLKGIGFLALAGGVVLVLVAAGLGERGADIQSSAQRHGATFERIADAKELDVRVHNTTRPTMLDFYADWCVSCKEMERFTFSDPAVRERMSNMQLLQADVTRNSEADKTLLKRFGIFGPPAILFFDASGNEMRSLRVIGFQSAEQFRGVLDQALSRASQSPPTDR